MLVNNIIGQVIPFPAVVLVVGGLGVTFQGVVHQYLPKAFPLRELPGPAPCGDGIEGQGLNGDRILGGSWSQEVEEQQEKKAFFHRNPGH